MEAAALGFDIGGTKTAAALVCGDGRVLEAVQTPTPAAQGPDAVLAAAAALGRRLLGGAARRGVRVAGAGVGTAGTVDHASGTVVYATASLPGWAGTRVGDRLGAALGLPVIVDNDVNAVAFAETHRSAAPAAGTVLYAAVGTGIGGAIVRDGRLERGSTGTAGELAHLLVPGGSGDQRCGCGRRDHLEAVACGPALAAAYRRRTGSGLGQAGAAAGPDLRRVAALAAAGDAHADLAIVEGARVFGRTLAGLVNVLDPRAVVVGGGVAGIGPRWWRPMAEALRAECLPGPARLELHPARLGADAGVVGAALLGLAGPGTG